MKPIDPGDGTTTGIIRGGRVPEITVRHVKQNTLRAERAASERTLSWISPPAVLVILTLAAWIAEAGSVAPVELIDAEAIPQTAEHRISVLNDGLARLHLKPSMPGDASQTMDLALSMFKAGDQQIAVVGFELDAQNNAPRPTTLPGVKVPPGGTEIKITAGGLVPGVDYAGKLFGTVGQKTIIWPIVLTRVSVAPAFECPTDPLIVKPDGTVLITLNSTAPLGLRTVDLRLSTLTGKQDQIADVGLVDVKTGEWRAAEVGHPVSGDQIILKIATQGLEAGSTYLGKLSFATGKISLGECGLYLRARKFARVELATDVPSLSQSIVNASPFGKNETARLSLRLFGKGRLRRIDGIMASLDGPTESPEGSFDLDHLSFEVNGTAVKELMWSASTDSADTSSNARSIPKDGQMNITLIFSGLATGKYAFALRFFGNDTAEPGPKVDITLNVRQHWAYAVFAILVAVLLSMFISRGIVDWRKRILLINQLAQLDQERFDHYASLPSVVFLRVVIAQTRRLMGKIWILPMPDSVYDYLARAQRVCAILTRFAALKSALEALKNSSGLGSAAYFFNQEIQDVMRRIGPQPLDQKTTDEVLDDLKAIEGHLADAASWYWSVLRNKASVLIEQAKQVKEDLGDPKVVDDLITRLEPFPSTITLSTDQAYWMLKLLVSRREYHTDVVQLCKKYAETANLEETLRDADALAWNRLVAAIKNEQVKVALVDGSKEPQEVSPIKLTLKFADQALAESYLVNNLLTYEWHFTQTQAKAAQRTWTVELSSPRVTQYVTSACQLAVKVSIRWQSNQVIQSAVLAPLPLTVQKNRDLSFIRNFANSTSLPDLLLLLLVTIVAIVTALPALYFSKATFGSFADYVAILAWAIGIDQGKNLIQLLKT
jgi:hypothetical protein